MGRKETILAAWAVALLLAIGAGCGGRKDVPPPCTKPAKRSGAVAPASKTARAKERPRGPAAKGPSIILLTIDTLRADHLSCYGYRRNTSPFIDQVASRGALFQNAYSTAPWTAPSMASLFTGLYPREHGVLHGRATGRDIAKQESLDDDLITLPEALRQAGYRTFGITSNGHLSRSKGFARGFDFFQLSWFEKCPTPHITALQLKSELAKPGAFFLWIHYFDPHAPYFAREPWIDGFSANRPAADRWAGAHMKVLREQIVQIRADLAARTALEDLYDSEIRYCDDFIRQLFADVIPPGEHIVVITSDHGEEFLDHNFVGHGHSLFEEVVRIPLVIQAPGFSGRAVEVKTPVSNRDVFATIMDLADARIDEPVPGTSLVPWMTGKPDRDYGPVYLELDRGRNWKGIRVGDSKLVCRGRDLERCMAFDLKRDPGETHGRGKKDKDGPSHLRKQLDEWMASKPQRRAPVTQERLNRDQVEKLRSLGYLR